MVTVLQPDASQLPLSVLPVSLKDLSLEWDERRRAQSLATCQYRAFMPSYIDKNRDLVRCDWPLTDWLRELGNNKIQRFSLRFPKKKNLYRIFWHLPALTSLKDSATQLLWSRSAALVTQYNTWVSKAQAWAPRWLWIELDYIMDWCISCIHEIYWIAKYNITWASKIAAWKPRWLWIETDAEATDRSGGVATLWRWPLVIIAFPVIIIVVVIITTRQKPAYGQQGLAGGIVKP